MGKPVALLAFKLVQANVNASPNAAVLGDAIVQVGASGVGGVGVVARVVNDRTGP